MTLSASFLKNLKRPGRYGDGRGGRGLSLLVKPTANGKLSKTWSQRLNINGRKRQIGIGVFPEISLADAREKAFQNRRIAMAGKDPTRPDRHMTLKEAFDGLLLVRKTQWTPGGRSDEIWRASFRDHVFPVMGNPDVSNVRVVDVLDVIEPLWARQQPTAKRVLQRMNLVFQWCVARGYCDTNPASAASAVLPKLRAIQPHHKSIHHSDIAKVMHDTSQSKGVLAVRLCFQLIVFTACRSGEARGALWSEFDVDKALWTIPAERMKLKREHRVPLSAQVLKVVEWARQLQRSGNPLVFPSPRSGTVMSDVSPLKHLQVKLGRDGTIHGFRSSFRDWCAETNKPGDAAEAALAHKPQAVEAAYFRSDLLEKRRTLMQEWADYIAPDISVSPEPITGNHN